MRYPSIQYALTIFLAAAGICLAQSADDSTPAPSNIIGSPYPRIHLDGRVTFRIQAADARKVQLMPGGADNGLGAGPFDMVKDERGAWSVTTKPAVPGFHYYWFLVDGVPVNDYGSESFFGWNKESSGVEVPEKGVDFYEAKPVPHGEVRIHPYFSKLTGQWRQAYIYAPPGYDSSRERYPVLYLQHGAGENVTTWTKQGHVNFILDNLIAEGKAKPMLVVMDTGYATLLGAKPVASAAGGQPQTPNGFEEVLLTEVIPMIDASFRTVADREHRAMAGLSMGARQTLQIALTHPDKFAWIGSFSSPPITDFSAKTSYEGAFADAAAFNKKNRLLWIGAGTAEDRMHAGAVALHEALEKQGIHNVLFESQGTAHEFQTWRRSLHDFAPRLFR